MEEGIGTRFNSLLIFSTCFCDLWQFRKCCINDRTVLDSRRKAPPFKGVSNSCNLACLYTQSNSMGKLEEIRNRNRDISARLNPSISQARIESTISAYRHWNRKPNDQFGHLKIDQAATLRLRSLPLAERIGARLPETSAEAIDSRRPSLGGNLALWDAS
jgi:hypothetical protein